MTSLRRRFTLAGAALALSVLAGPALALIAVPPPPAPPAVAHRAAKAAHRHKVVHARLTPGAAQLVAWVRASKDNHGVPFAVIDKQAARVWVFGSDARLRGTAPVLVGAARGDDTVPGIGDRPLSQVKPDEKTTPAGRFVAEHGTNLRKEHVIWVDYDAAVSMHPVLTTNPKEHRLERLASPNPADHRISFGCINVPKVFYRSVVLGTLSATEHPIVYVLPETRSLAATFAGWHPVGAEASRPPSAAQARR